MVVKRINTLGLPHLFPIFPTFEAAKEFMFKQMRVGTTKELTEHITILNSRAKILWNELNAPELTNNDNNSNMNNSI